MRRSIEKIMAEMPKNHADRIVSMSDGIGIGLERGLTDYVKQHRCHLRGYIICLRDCGYVDNLEMRRLVAFFGTDRF